MKDYKELQEKLTEKKEYTRKELTELGFSDYDINKLIETGVFTRIKRGIYAYKNPELAPETMEVNNSSTTPENKENIELNVNYYPQAITYIIKREPALARESFEKQLILTPDNSNKLRYGMFSTYIFEKDYHMAYQILRELISEEELTIAPNYYACLMMLKEYVEVDGQELFSLMSRCMQVPTAKMGQNTKKMLTALENEDYENAFKFINYNISFDKKCRKYRLTNQTIRFLCECILRDKGLYKEKEEREALTKSAAPQVEINSEQVIVVPNLKEETMIPNLLIEAINRNDYEGALSILESSNVDNPSEVIKILLTKLSMIKSLLTTDTPVKVVATEPVRVVEETKIEVLSEEKYSKEETTSQQREKY